MIFQEVKRIFSAELNIDESKITMESRLIDDLGLDSLDAAEVVMNLEDTYDIQIDDEAAQNFKTVADLIHYIEAALEK